MSRFLLVTVALVSLFGSLALASDKKVVRPKDTPPNAGWSHGLLVGDTLYISGMAGEDAAGKIPQMFEDEVKQSLSNIGAVLSEAGMSMADIVSVQVYLSDEALFDRMNVIYKTVLPDPKPTRTTVIVHIVGTGHIEITATARK